MNISDYSLRLAEKHVEEYRQQDSIISQHKEAMDCCDCEEFLQLGIEARKWLEQADRILRQAAVKGLEVPAEVKDALAELYRNWLLPCAHAESRIQEQERRQYQLKNLQEFREAQEYVERQVRLMEMEDRLESAFRGDVFDAAFWSEAGKMRSS